MIKGQNNHEELVEKEKEASRGRTHTDTHGAGRGEERISEEKNQNAYAEP